MKKTIAIRHIFISPGHNFRGHHGKPPGENPVRECASVSCVAGSGIEGDRYFNYKDNYKGQITFFDIAVYRRLLRACPGVEAPPSAMRRNVLTEGIDLNTLIGRVFEIQGIRFEGVQECAPCYWMDEAVGAGAEDFLRGHGGLRARILSSGSLSTGEATLILAGEKSA